MDRSLVTAKARGDIANLLLPTRYDRIVEGMGGYGQADIGDRSGGRRGTTAVRLPTRCVDDLN